MSIICSDLHLHVTEAGEVGQSRLYAARNYKPLY